MAIRKYARRKGLLNGARAYLSGPMDFMADRAAEKKYGWRNRVSQFLRHYGVTVFDPMILMEPDKPSSSPVVPLQPATPSTITSKPANTTVIHPLFRLVNMLPPTA